MKLTELSAMDPRYRRFRAELRAATRIDEAAFIRWIRACVKPLEAGYQRTGENGSPIDFLSWASLQYTNLTRGPM